MNILDKISPNECTGCFGCQNSCPKDAIKLLLNEEGFYFPKIDKKKCDNCGLCIRKCPLLNNYNDRDNKYSNPLVFAARTNDSRLLLKSSSGGIFGEIAREVLLQNGMVFGAAWDYNLKLQHVGISDEKEMEKLLGSKYIQSNINFTYRKVAKEAVKRKVLFCGTPCQIRALNLFLKDTAEEAKNNILTCDLICHGVPSIKVFEIYLDFLEKKYKSKISEIYFRNKSKGWNDYCIEVVFKNGERYKKSHRLDPFLQYFLSDIFLRESCYSCKFSKIPRTGDLTLGDLWGALKKYYNPKGVSVVLINTLKGKEMIEKLKREKKIKIEKYPFEQILASNPRIDGYEIKTARQKKFFQDISENKKTFEKIILDYNNFNGFFYFLFKIKQTIKDLIFPHF